jgi:BioD-like phosphotransacetylase family protein
VWKLVKTIFLIGERGKSVLIYGLLRKFSSEGLRVGYFKPISKARYKLPSMTYIDPDVITLKQALNLEDSLEDMNPIIITRSILNFKNNIESLKKRIEEAYSRIASGKDVVLAESYPNLEVMTSIGFPLPQLTKMLNAKTVFVLNVKERDVVDEVVDKLILYNCYFEYHGAKIDGVIVNNVPIYYSERVEDVIVPEIERLGLKVYGVIREKARLTAPTVSDVVEALNAEILENKDKLNNIVEDILIGAMAPTAALRWLRRAINAAIVTGGDRTDLIITALETKPSVVILTGGLYPDISVLVKARETGTPILLVPYDTYTTVEKLREVQSIITPSSLKAKETDILETIEKEVKWKELLQ